MRIEVEHRLTLTLPPTGGQTVLHLLLTPGSGPTQSVDTWQIEADGIETAGRFTDAFGNSVHLVNQGPAEGPVSILARGTVLTRDTSGVLGRPGHEPVPALYRRRTELAKAPEGLAEPYRGATLTRLEILHELMARVGEALGLADTPDGQAQMAVHGGQVQRQGDNATALPPAADYAHGFIGAARSLDIPARYVTGYLAPAHDHEGGLHAWAEAYDEGLGWIGFDPRLQICPTDRHVRLAIGLDAQTALPLRTVPVGELVQSVAVRSV